MLAWGQGMAVSLLAPAWPQNQPQLQARPACHPVSCLARGPGEGTSQMSGRLLSPAPPSSLFPKVPPSLACPQAQADSAHTVPIAPRTRRVFPQDMRVWAGQ